MDGSGLPERWRIAFGLSRSTARELGVAFVTVEQALRTLGAADGEEFVSDMLTNAAADGDADDLELAITFGEHFGFSPASIRTLADLAADDWHHSHERIVETLGENGDPAVLPALIELLTAEPPAMAHDDTRSLARRAIWAMRTISDPRVDGILDELRRHDDGSAVPDDAAEVLRVRRSDPDG